MVSGENTRTIDFSLDHKRGAHADSIILVWGEMIFGPVSYFKHCLKKEMISYQINSIVQGGDILI